ncbi:collagen alpha-1(XIV) chain-like [Stylophora pistillata]|uniref:collagen alpha-1(XIV) chain-like n=1 Tax=Stylophora pistillata TaxID=50429 RepID=UPI000C0515C2|nr:collagen alpha-1(XIV) chain-like [Stylophora pistillata]
MRIRPVRPKPVRPRFPAGSVSHVGVTADIAFLIDGSRYVGRRNFHFEKAFIKSIARRFTISKHQSHIGVATYGSRPHLRMRLNQCNSLGLVLRTLNHIRFPNQAGRRVDLGLQASLRYFFARRPTYSFVRKVLVALVSGKQTARSSYLISRLPSQFRRYGVKVFIIGVGYVDQRYLRPFTYRNKHVYVVRSYSSLVARAGTIAKAIHLEMNIERERYHDLQKRLNFEAGRNSNEIQGEPLIDETMKEGNGELYINGTQMEGNGEQYIIGTQMEGNAERFINGTQIEGNAEQYVNGTQMEGNAERYINGTRMDGNGERYINGTQMEGNAEQYINGTRIEDNGRQRNGTEFFKTL